MRWSTRLKLLAVMLIWAASWIFIKVALREIPPYSLAFLRFSLASPILFIIALFKEGKENMKVRLNELPIYSILALSGVTLLYVTEFTALKYTTAINASILINASVIFIALLAFFFLGEKLRRKEWTGIIISFVGAALVVSNGSLKFFHESTFIGDILIMVSAIFWAIYSIVGKKFLETREPLVVTTYAFVLGTIFLLPFSLYEGVTSVVTRISMVGWFSVIYLAVFCSVFAYVVWYQAIKEEKASKVAVFLYSIPLFTALFANIFLGERITIYMLLGGALVIYGVHLTESKN